MLWRTSFGNRGQFRQVPGKQIQVVESGGAALRLCDAPRLPAQPRGVAGGGGGRDAADHLHRQDDQRRPGRERRGEEPRPHDSRIPEGPPPQADIEEGRDRVDRNRPDDGDEDKGDVKPLGRRPATIAAIEQVAANMDVEQEIAVQDEDIPTQHGGRKVELADAGDQVPEPVGPPEVHRDEGQAHEDGRHGEQFAEDHQVMQLLVVVDIDRDHHHHRRRRDADQEGEVGNIDAPRHLVAHAGDDQPVGKLPGVGVEAQQAEDRQHPHPGVIAPVPHKRQAAAAPQEDQIIPHGLPHTSK